MPPEALSNSGYPWISGVGHSATPPTTPPAAPPARPPSRRQLRIGLWGNALAVHLPRGLSSLLNLQRGDVLELQLLRTGQRLLTPGPRRSRIALCQALEQATP